MSSDAKPVIVLGAGLSGLYAAVCLKRSGIPARVLEARDRIGGRVYTKLLNGMTYELGAEWVGERDVLMHKACDEYGIKLVNHGLTTQLLYEGVRYAPGEEEVSDAWEPKVAELVARFETLSEDEIRHLQQISWNELLLTWGIPQKDRELLDLSRSTDFGEDLRFIPAYDVLYDYFVGGDGPNACTKSISGGNVRLAEAMLREIGEEALVLSCEATKVREHDGNVEVTCADGTTYTGRAVIAAIPPQAIRRMVWEPGLPASQAEAYEEIEYARIAKTAVHFAKRFWPETFELLCDRLPQQIYHGTPGRLEEEGILMAYTVGDRAEIFAHMSKEEKAQQVQDAVQEIFDEPLPAAETVDSYYWGEDPYTGGAYPRFSGDQRRRLQPEFRKAHGRVFFAGEHTAKRYGFMEGAIEAGERAAGEVVAFLQG